MKTKTTTTDIYLASALLALGAKIESTDKSDPRHVKFTLNLVAPIYSFQSTLLPDASSVSVNSATNGIEYYENLWANGTLMINAVAFKNAIQQMKSVIHSS